MAQGIPKALLKAATDYVRSGREKGQFLLILLSSSRWLANLLQFDCGTCSPIFPD
jgi:hypothetical protein